MAYITQNYIGIKQETVPQLWRDIFTVLIPMQHILKRNNFVVLTFWANWYYCAVHFYICPPENLPNVIQKPSNGHQTIEITLPNNVINFSAVLPPEKKT